MSNKCCAPYARQHRIGDGVFAADRSLINLEISNAPFTL